MTITANSDFTTITIYSANLTDFGVITSVTLDGKINCEGSYTDTIVSGDVSAGTFTLDTTTLFEQATLEDNIYGLKLTIVKTDDSVITEYGCLFVDNDFKCDVADKVAEDIKSELSARLSTLYYLLSKGQDCDCDCSNICIIYEDIKNELNDCTSC